jgi:heat shock protein HslJ
MLRLRRRFVCCCLVFASLLGTATASDRTFPFDRELVLEAAPMRGSKRVPIIEIGENGAASIDLWCARLRGEANVGADTISIVPGPAEPMQQCAPERQNGDEKLLAALVQVTNWRRTGDVVELSGSTTLRFRLMTN